MIKKALTTSAAAFSFGVLLASAAFAGAPTVPSNDPSCPGCSLTTGHIVELKTGDFCMWAELSEDNDNGRLFAVGVWDGNYALKASEMQKGKDNAFKTNGEWHGDVTTFEHNNGPNGNCGSPGGTQVFDLHRNTEGDN